MFCCSICSVMFTGACSESVVTTPCGHLFHSECILLCLKKFSKCPFCTVRVSKYQLTKLHFQVDANWKRTATDLKTKVNTSIINLDESSNDPNTFVIAKDPCYFKSIDLTSMNVTIIEDSDDSVIIQSPLPKSADSNKAIVMQAQKKYFPVRRLY